MIRVAFIGACAAVCTTCAFALAAAPDPAAAEALFRSGRERAEAGDWGHACSLFVESNRLEFAFGTSMNLAACEEHTGKLASAWELYKELLDLLPLRDDRRSFVAQSVARLDRAVPRLTIVVAGLPVDGITITRDGVDVGAASIGPDLPVDPGEHSIMISAPGRATRRYEIALTPGQRLTLNADPGEPFVADGPNAFASNAPTRNEGRTAGWIVGGVGVGALAVGSVLGIRALSDRSASDGLCPAGVCRTQAALDDYDATKSMALGADIALAVGAVSLAVGGYLLVASLKSDRPSTAALLRVSPSGVGLSW